MPTTPCPACGWPVTYDTSASTIGCPSITCRVSEFYPLPRLTRRPTEARHG